MKIDEKILQELEKDKNKINSSQSEFNVEQEVDRHTLSDCSIMSHSKSTSKKSAKEQDFESVKEVNGEVLLQYIDSFEIEPG